MFNADDTLHSLSQKVAAAEAAVGGGGLPAGYSYSSLAELCANLNLSFDGTNADHEHCGVVSGWANQYLSNVGCNQLVETYHMPYQSSDH